MTQRLQRRKLYRGMGHDTLALQKKRAAVTGFILETIVFETKAYHKKGTLPFLLMCIWQWKEEQIEEQ